MNIQQTKFSLWCGAAVLATASLGTIATAWVWPYTMPKPVDAQPNKDPARQNVRHQPLPKLSTFEPVWGLDLRRQLYNQPQQQRQQHKPKPTPAARPRPARAHTAARLAGTVIEPGHSVAMFIMPNGRIQLKSVGEKIGELLILDITAERVCARHRGEKVNLLLDKRKKQ